MVRRNKWKSATLVVSAIAVIPALFAVALAQAPKQPAAEPSSPSQRRANKAADATPPTTPAAKAAPSRLGDEIRAAAKEFHAVATGDLASAQRNLQLAIVELDQYLATMDPDYAYGWKEYLRFDPLVQEVWKSGDYDVATLYKTQRRFYGGFVGLEEPQFQAVAQELLTFTQLAEAVQNKELQADYKRHLEELAATVDAVGEGRPTVEQSAAIARNVAWLESVGQAPQLVEQLSNRYSQPNLLIDVSEQLVAESLSRPIDRTEPVVDCILGTSIRGTGRTIGAVNVDLVPNGEQAQLVTHLEGINYSRTVGSNRSALIYSRGQTTLSGDSTLYVNDAGLAPGPIQTRATVRNTITGFGSTRGGILGNIVKKIAAKKAPKQQAQAQAIAAAHARTRLTRSMQKEIIQLVGDANEEIDSRLRRPLLRFGQYPARLHYSTTDDAIAIRALQTTRGRMAAPGAPPQPAGDAPVSVRIHQSLITNSTQGMLAGRKFDQQRIQLLAESILGEVPERLQPKPGEEPFSITFADVDPVGLSLEDDTATFTIRGKAFTSGDRSFEAMNITGVYKLSSDGRGLKAVRQGDFDIVPPDFKRGGAARLNTRQIVLKRILTEKFGKAFPAEVVRDGTKVEDEQSDFGTLYVSSLKADGDWLVLGVKREPTGPAETTAGREVGAVKLAVGGQ